MPCTSRARARLCVRAHGQIADIANTLTAITHTTELVVGHGAQAHQGAYTALPNAPPGSGRLPSEPRGFEVVALHGGTKAAAVVSSGNGSTSIVPSTTQGVGRTGKGTRTGSESDAEQGGEAHAG